MLSELPDATDLDAVEPAATGEPASDTPAKMEMSSAGALATLEDVTDSGTVGTAADGAGLEPANDGCGPCEKGAVDGGTKDSKGNIGMHSAIQPSGTTYNLEE